MTTEVLQQLDARPFKDLCGSRFTPNRLTGILQLWLSSHFSSSNNISETGLKDRVWSNNPESTKIQILPVEQWEPLTTELRPAILLKQQDLKFIRIGIDNRLMGGGPPHNTKRMHSARMEGSHSVICLAGEAGEAKQLAAEVSDELIRFAPIVRVWLNFLRIELVGISPLSKLEEASENYAISIDLAYSYLQEWEILSLDDPILTGIKSVFGY